MCSKTVRVRRLFERRGSEVAHKVGEFFGDSFAKLADDLAAGRAPVKIGFADVHGSTYFGYSREEAQQAASAGNSSY